MREFWTARNETIDGEEFLSLEKKLKYVSLDVFDWIETEMVKRHS